MFGVKLLWHIICKTKWYIDNELRRAEVNMIRISITEKAETKLLGILEKAAQKSVRIIRREFG